MGGAFSKYAGFFEKGGNRVKKTAWKNRIISATKAVCTYRDAFLPMIDTLANILAERDKIYQEYVDKRRANWKMTVPGLVKCSKCGALMMPHRVCKACGSYNKKEIISAE